MKKDWRQNWVVYPIPCSASMKSLMSVSRIVLYRVESALDLRIARAAEQQVDLTNFIKLTGDFEQRMFQDNNLVVTRHFTNNYTTVEEFNELSLSKYDFSDKSIVRPSWDKYFMQLSHLVA